MKQLLLTAESAAVLDQPLFITGESGTGKSTIARLVHDFSPWCARPFVPVHCTRLTTGSAIAELFARLHIDSASDEQDGASDELGEVRATLLLEHVGALPLELQPKLLPLFEDELGAGILPEGRGRPNVRVIATSRENLSQLCDEQQFSYDLYSRLDALRMDIPPLRGNSRQIKEIANRLLCCYKPRRDGDHYRITDEAMRLLCDYDWPGNIRELRRAIGHACSLAFGTTIAMADLQFLLPQEV